MSYDIDQAARACHAAVRVVQAVNGERVAPPWEELGEEDRASAERGVMFALQGGSPEAQHAEWVRCKTAEGWVRGPVKDPVARTHPALVPYDQLPEGQKVKDYLVTAVTRAMLGPPPPAPRVTVLAEAGSLWGLVTVPGDSWTETGIFTGQSGELVIRLGDRETGRFKAGTWHGVVTSDPQSGQELAALVGGCDSPALRDLASDLLEALTCASMDIRPFATGARALGVTVPGDDEDDNPDGDVPETRREAGA